MVEEKRCNGLARTTSSICAQTRYYNKAIQRKNAKNHVDVFNMLTRLNNLYSGGKMAFTLFVRNNIPSKDSFETLQIQRYVFSFVIINGEMKEEEQKKTGLLSSTWN